MLLGTSVIANLVSIFVYPENKRLSRIESMLTLLFDLSQLGVLVLLTGGLTNPFALLLLVPVTISASVLDLRTTIILALAAMVFVTLGAFVRTHPEVEDIDINPLIFFAEVGVARAPDSLIPSP